MVHKETDEVIMDAVGSISSLMNQKSGHKNACIHHETNGESYLNPVISLGR